MKIILASTSPYRTQLLKKTGFEFLNLKPQIDEEKIKDKLLEAHETPLAVARHLAQAKGRDVAAQHPRALVISGDQLVDFEGTIIGKPHTRENAIGQLEMMNGRAHTLITSTAIFYQNKVLRDDNLTFFKMKKLTLEEITAYVDLDQPLDCAGSCKIEEHGLSLFERIDCSDFSAIQGLPLIWLTNILKGFGCELFKKKFD